MDIFNSQIFIMYLLFIKKLHYSCRLTDLGGVGKKVVQDLTTWHVEASTPKLRRSHSMSEIAAELGAHLLSEVLLKKEINVYFTFCYNIINKPNTCRP